MEHASSAKYDVVVVGGGPAGSTTAALVAMQGYRVLLLEREKFPRYQIGESLLPATVHGVCHMLGVDDEIKQAGFMVKNGGTFKWGANPAPWTFSFAASPKLAGPTSFAYQVERMKFDDILLRNARRVGVEVRENCVVTGLSTDEERVRGVHYVDSQGRERLVGATFVVDASGNRSRISGGTNGSRRYSEFFRNIALFGYFENGKRLPPPNSGNILSVAFESGWFWYIPLTDRLTSVGAVVAQDMAGKVQGDPERALLRLVSECPLISEYLSDARRVTDGVYGDIRVRKDYSYCNTAFWRPGMVLVGDAACFVDPVFSSGVHLATYSGLLAARSINSVLAGRIEEKVAFQEFESRYRREYGVFYEFLACFYNMHVDEHSYFWQAKKVTNYPASELAAFVELVGGVASGEGALLARESVAQRLSSSSNDLAAAAELVALDEAASMEPVFTVPLVRRVLSESIELQARAWLGKDAPRQAPLHETGLVSADDGTHWEYPAREVEDIVDVETSARNKETIRRWIEVSNSKDHDGLDDLFTEDTIDHAGNGVGVDHWKSLYRSINASFPDWQATVHQVIAEGDLVVVRGSGTGTHQGSEAPLLQGIEPTGRRVTMSVHHTFRLVDGKIAEHWANRDDFGMLHALGAI